MYTEQIAQVAHEINAAFCIALGDSTQLTWQQLPDELKLVTIRQVQYHLANPGTTIEATHDEWMAEMIRQGWTAGKMNIASKQHPCLVPFGEIPVTEKAKTHLFLQVVNSLRQFFGN